MAEAQGELADCTIAGNTGLGVHCSGAVCALVNSKVCHKTRIMPSPSPKPSTPKPQTPNPKLQTPNLQPLGVHCSLSRALSRSLKLTGKAIWQAGATYAIAAGGRGSGVARIWGGCRARRPGVSQWVQDCRKRDVWHFCVWRPCRRPPARFGCHGACVRTHGRSARHASTFALRRLCAHPRSHMCVLPTSYTLNPKP